jgi:copper resistance protein C
MRMLMTIGAGLLAMCGTSHAHSRLLSSAPAANAVVTAPPSLRLAFGEKVEGKLTGATLKCADKESIVPGEPVLSPDGKVVEMGLPSLPKGNCNVQWHAVSVDGHRTSGEFSFTVH